MSFRHAGRPGLQRPGASLSWPGSPVHVLTRTSASQGPLPPQGLATRCCSANSLPRRLPLPAAAAAGTAVPFSRSRDLAAPDSHTPSPPSDTAPDEALQRLQREVQERTDQVGWLESWRQDVKDQAERVLQRLNRARQELADCTAAQPSTAAQLHRLSELKEQVSLLQWRHRQLGPRQQDAARILQEERAKLTAAQDRLSALGPAAAPPSLSPPSTPSSDASFATASAFTGYHTPEYDPEGSIASDEASADLRQQSVAQLQRQASELGRQVQVQEERLTAAEETSTNWTGYFEAAAKAYQSTESRIAQALTHGDANRRTRLETAQVRLYQHMVDMRQQAVQGLRERDALAEQLAAVRRDLDEMRRQLAEEGVNLVAAALPLGSAAVARLAERAARRTPRSLAGWLRHPFSKGAPKPLEGKRQDAFMDLVRADVMKVARHANIPFEQAADLMSDGVQSTALGSSLTLPDRNHLLRSLAILD